MFGDISLFTVFLIEMAILIPTLFFTIFYWAYWLPRQPYAFVLRKHQNTYFVVSKKILKGNPQTFSFANKTYAVQWERNAYMSSKGKAVLLYIEGNPEPISLDTTIKPKYDAGKLDLIIHKNVLMQILRSAQANPALTSLMILAITFACGLFLGIIVSPYVLRG